MKNHDYGAGLRLCPCAIKKGRGRKIEKLSKIYYYGAGVASLSPEV